MHDVCMIMMNDVNHMPCSEASTLSDIKSATGSLTVLCCVGFGLKQLFVS